MRVTQIGSHIFYRFGGRRGGSGQFVQAVQASGPVSQTPATTAPDISDVAVNLAPAETPAPEAAPVPEAAEAVASDASQPVV